MPPQDIPTAPRPPACDHHRMPVNAMPEWDEDDELDTRKPLLLRVTAIIVVIGLVLLIANLFFDLILRRL